MINVKDSKLYDLLPVNLRDDRDIVAAAEAIDESNKSINSFVEKLNFRSNPEIQDDYILDALAADMHVDYYDKNFPSDIKRKIIDNSMILHMLKGTAGSVERALATVNLNGVVQEWWEYDGDPYHFQIEIAAFTSFDVHQAKKLIQEYKNLRSWFDGFIVVLKDIVTIRANSYTFPVPYPITGTFNTAPVDGIGSSITVKGEITKYTFAVPYPVSGTFYCSEGVR